MLLVSSDFENLPTAVHGGTNLKTEDRVLSAQGSSMHKGNEGYPVWSKPTECLLWHTKFNDGYGRNASHHTLMCMGLCSRRPIRVPMMTPVSTIEHLNCPLQELALSSASYFLLFLFLLILKCFFTQSKIMGAVWSTDVRVDVQA